MGGNVERANAVLVGGPSLGPAREQGSHDVRVAALRRQVERRDAASVGGPSLGSAREQDAHDLLVALDSQAEGAWWLQVGNPSTWGRTEPGS